MQGHLSKLKQQLLQAGQAILTVNIAVPIFFFTGLAYIGIGLQTSNNVKKFVYDYTDCISQEYPITSCAGVLRNTVTKACTCVVPFTLTEKFEGDVNIYYGLSNFYQNHRQYVESRDEKQLLGALGPVSIKCEPFARYADPNNPSVTKQVVPCGAIANSIYNDTLTLSRKDGNPVPVLNTGIALPSDKEMKFRNPPNSQFNLSEVYKDYVKPPNWRKSIWELDPSNPDNNGLQNEDLIVWMRTAAFPTFRKLYRRLNRTAEGYHSGLMAGNYFLRVEYNYPVHSFGGRKRIIISTTSFLGDKNPFFNADIAITVLGCIFLLLATVLLILHIIKYGKSKRENYDQRDSSFTLPVKACV